MTLNTELNEALDEILLAVQANIEYLKANGSSQALLKSGKLIETVGEEVFVYEFKADKLQELDPDSDIELRINDSTVTGKVVSVSDGAIQVQVEAFIGPYIAEAWLVISSYFLLEKLTERLLSFKSKEVGLSDIAPKVMNFSTFETGEYSGFKSKNLELNEYQRKAVSKSLGSEVTYIWGPPGTGKTDTIASIIEGCIAKGESVLLVSHTNAATDGAVKALASLLKGDPVYEEGRILREGRLSKEIADLNVSPEVIMKTKTEPIRKEIEKLAPQILKLENQISISSYQHTFGDYQAPARSRLEEVQDAIDQTQSNIDSLKETFHSLGEAIKTQDHRVAAFQGKGSLGKLFSGTSINSLMKNKAALISQRDSTQKQGQAMAAQLKTYKAQLAEAQREAQKALGQEDHILSPAELKEAQRVLKNLKEQKSSLEEEISKFGEALIANAAVIATTLTMSYMSKRVLGREYDCVILDEASMAPLPAVLCAAGIAKQRAVIVGDFYQLPPIAKHEVMPGDKTPAEVVREKELVKQWLQRDIFNDTGIEESVLKGTQDDRLVPLRVQYRMHPDISGLVNRIVYERGGKKYSLIDGAGMDTRGEELLSQEPLSGAHLGIINTHSLNPYGIQSDSRSVYNIIHGLVIVELVSEAIKSGYQKIGVVAAYRAQVNLIKKIMKDELSEEDQKKVLVDTVHRFQGGQKQIMFFDVTTPKSGTMYDFGEDYGDDVKLINVALSRAQEKCLIIGDVEEIKKHHSINSKIKTAIDYCEEKHFPVIDGGKYLQSYQADEKTERWLDSIESANDITKGLETVVVDQSDFYVNFLRDCRKAKQEIIIASPFITTKRIDKLIGVFEQLIGKGIRIFLITRPPDMQSDNMKTMSLKELPRLEKAGVIVIPLLAKTHEKVAIIDRKVLWAGSLNIMSQRDTTEMMFKVTSEKAAGQMMTFMGLEKNIGPLGENRLKRCEICTAPGSWYWTAKLRRSKIWTFCLTGVHAEGKPPMTKEQRTTRKTATRKIRETINLNEDGIPICPNHNVATLRKRGPFGWLYGCPYYQSKNCRYAVDEKKVLKLAEAASQKA